MRLNTDIIDFIRNNDDFDDNVKKFLIQILILELERYKADYKHYFKEYDSRINNYIEKWDYGIT